MAICAEVKGGVGLRAGLFCETDARAIDADGVRYPLFAEPDALTVPLSIAPDRMVSVFSECVPLVNLIADGDFSAGMWSGGTLDTAHFKYGSRAVKLTGTTASLEVLAVCTQAVPLLHTHIYYARYEGFQESRTDCGVGLYYPIAEPCFGVLSVGNAGVWNLYSWCHAQPSFADGNYQLRLDFDNNKLAGTIWMDGVMLIDLTAAFGAGNEPDKAWCDANIPFFHGVRELPVFASR